MAFAYYSPLTVNGGQVPSTQTDFPVLISVTDARFKTVANSGHVQNSSGFDIRPYSDSALTTAITGYELERYNASTGEVVMHVNRSSLANGNVTYLAYGDSSITTDGSSTTTWSNSFLGVYHLKDGTTLDVNSATGSNNGTNHGATVATGQIDGAASFASISSQYVDLGAAIAPTSITLSAWINPTSFPNAYNTVIARSVSGSNLADLLVKSNGKMAMYVTVTGPASVAYDPGSHTLTAGTWYHVALTYTGTSNFGLKGYVNAALDGNPISNLNLITTTGNTNIGRDPGSAGSFFNGVIDEARVASVARSADWITTEYNNQSAPGTFMTLGTEVSNSIQQLLAGSLQFSTLLGISNSGVSSYLLDLSSASLYMDGAPSSTVRNLLTKITNKVLSAAVSFVGVIKKQCHKLSTAALSFVGSFTKRCNKALSGALSFIGSIVAVSSGSHSQSFTAVLSFSGQVLKLDLKSLIGASLSFAGAIKKRTGNALDAATLSFAGVATNKSKKTISAVLSFIGSTSKSTSQLFAAALSFIGVQVKSLRELLTATLSFIGSIQSLRNKMLTAVLGLVGVIQKRATVIKSASLGFISNEINRLNGIIIMGLTAALSFIGQQTSGHPAVIFTAALSFTGSCIKGVSKKILSILSFSGDFLSNLNGAFRKAFTATLSFSGLWRTPFRKLLSSILGFRGSRSHLYGKLQTIFLIQFVRNSQEINSYETQTSKGLGIVMTQDITTTPSILDTGAISSLFVKNTDSFNSVLIDSSSSFNKFPQFISPGLGVFLSTSGVDVYAKTNTGTATVQILAAP